MSGNVQTAESTRRHTNKMDAQQIVDTCQTSDFNPRQFRKEMNIAWLINDVRKQLGS